MSLTIHILVTISILVTFIVCCLNMDFINDSKAQSIEKELAEVKPLLSENMYKRVSDDAMRGSGTFARCVTVSEKPSSIKDKVLRPVAVLCGLAFWPSVITTVFNLSCKDSLGVVVVCVIGLFAILVIGE